MLPFRNRIHGLKIMFLFKTHVVFIKKKKIDWKLSSLTKNQGYWAKYGVSFRNCNPSKKTWYHGVTVSGTRWEVNDVFHSSSNSSTKKKWQRFCAKGFNLWLNWHVHTVCSNLEVIQAKCSQWTKMCHPMHKIVQHVRQCLLCSTFVVGYSIYSKFNEIWRYSNKRGEFCNLL